MVLLRFFVLAGSLFVGLYAGHPDPPPHHCWTCAVIAAALAVVACVILWEFRKNK